MQIYFICTGNTCRSPMAEAVLKHKQLSDVEVRSAGVYAQNGSAMSINAKKVLLENGILENHRSAEIDPGYIDQADVILTMTRSHLHALIQYFPQAANKIYTLSEYVNGKATDITDPYGGNIDVYRQTFEELQQLLDALQSKILED